MANEKSCQHDQQLLHSSRIGDNFKTYCSHLYAGDLKSKETKNGETSLIGAIVQQNFS